MTLWLSDNLSLRLATHDDHQSDGAFVATTKNNKLLFDLTTTTSLSNAGFIGIVIDTDVAYISSRNEQQYNAYYKLMGVTPFYNESRVKNVRYGIAKEILKSTARIDFPSGNLWIFFNIHIVSAHISVNLSLDDMDRLGLHFQNIANSLINGESGSYAKAIRYRGHASVKWNPHMQTDFSTAELHCLYRRFGHLELLWSWHWARPCLKNFGIDFHSPWPPPTPCSSPCQFKFKLKEI